MATPAQWVAGARPRTLSAALSPVLVGTAAAYGYSGLGELAVLLFFGFVATAGSAYVQLERVPAGAWWGAVAVGLLACAILLANNIRDIDTDRATGKRTLPVLVGAPAARGLFVACSAGAFVAVAAVGVLYPPALIALAALPLAVHPVRLVMTRHDPPSLVAALVATARLELVVAVLLSIGLVTA